jgi:hypothetical protein
MPANDSFIDANSMSTIELADLLKQLSENDKKYNEFFNFKKRPLSDEFQEIALMSYTHPNVLCRICDYAVEAKNIS